MAELLPWLHSSGSQLAQYIAQNRIPQALLIVGKKGIGKQVLATHFSQSLLCMNQQVTDSFCGQCQACKLFSAGTHPDYYLLEPEEAGKAIGIAKIRQLTLQLSLKPQFDRHRVVVINPADSLNNASANAFLKYLEEPSERTCVILLTDKPAKLPATIRSRCQKIFITESHADVVDSWLKQQGVTESRALLLKLAQGAPLLAKEMAESDALTLRTEYFKQWLGLRSSAENLMILAEQWSKLDQVMLDMLLFWLISWVEDMIKLSYGQQPAACINLDLTKKLQETIKKLDIKHVYKYYDFLLLSQQRFDSQLNKQLMFEEILIKWIQLNSR